MEHKLRIGREVVQQSCSTGIIRNMRGKEHVCTSQRHNPLVEKYAAFLSSDVRSQLWVRIRGWDAAWSPPDQRFSSLVKKTPTTFCIRIWPFRTTWPKLYPVPFLVVVKGIGACRGCNAEPSFRVFVPCRLVVVWMGCPGLVLLP